MFLAIATSCCEDSSLQTYFLIYGVENKIGIKWSSIKTFSSLMGMIPNH